MQWFLKNGIVFNDVDKDISIKYAKEIHAKQKQCYHNSYRTLIEYPHLKYYEGYFMSERIPIAFDHCFLVNDNKIIDVTMAIKNRFDNDVYIGIEIPRDIVIKYAFKLKCTGDFIHNYYRDYIVSKSLQSI